MLMTTKNENLIEINDLMHNFTKIKNEKKLFFVIIWYHYFFRFRAVKQQKQKHTWCQCNSAPPLNACNQKKCVNKLKRTKTKN